MIITFFAEPRSGSTNLFNWLRASLNGFECFHEPENPVSKYYSGMPPGNIAWLKKDTNYLLSLKFYKEHDNSELMKMSDKLFYLYRENEKEQIESFVVARQTGIFHLQYNGETILKEIHKYQAQVDYFSQLKDDFKQFRTNFPLKTFTYEDLYERNKIGELIDYLGIETPAPFPFGERYRIKEEVKRLF